MTQLSDEEVKAAILSFLEKKGCWGAHYFPLDTMVNWFGRKVKKDGKRVRKCIGDLIGQGYILLHKKGKTVSLNPTRSMEIVEYIKRISKI